MPANEPRVDVTAIECVSLLRMFRATGRSKGMKTKIIYRPIGEAPEWVRDAWIGLSLPLASKRLRNRRGLGILSGPSGFFSQLWAILTGKSFKVVGYAVNAKTAVECLARVHPEAASWWRENTPALLNGRRYFVFDADACEPGS